MILFSVNKTLVFSNPFAIHLQSKPRLFPASFRLRSNSKSSKSLVYVSFPSAAATSAQNTHLQRKEDSFEDWGNFAARVSGEWDGYGAEFTAEGKPLELPESVVPDAFREWEVQIFDWQTQCPSLASETRDPLFFYKLVKLLPTVGCEADAATQYSVSERVVGGTNNCTLGFGFHPSGRYISLWPVDEFGGKRILELEHCFVNPKNWEERIRVIQVVRVEEVMVRLEKIWIFCEHRYGPFRNGEQLGGCAIKETGFALTNPVEASEILGEWEGSQRFSAGGLEGEQKFPIQQLVKDHSQNSIRGQTGLITLPKSIWCSLMEKDNGETCAEVGWLMDCRHAMTSRCVLHRDGRLKEMIMEEEERVLNDKSK